jgi:hypothetical protein
LTRCDERNLRGWIASLMVLAIAMVGSASTFRERVEAKRAVERARYRFVIGATKPFDDVYPRRVFVALVRQDLDEERVLKQAFGVTVTPKMLHDEYDRVEGTTQAPEQWAAIKKALNNDRRRIEELFCRPLLVTRVLHARFRFDSAIHAEPHQKARQARAQFLSKLSVPQARVISLSRATSEGPSTDEMLRRAQAESSLPRILTTPTEKPSDNAPFPIEPELAKVLEKELPQPGEVTTILEFPDRFDVYRLIERSDDAWRVEAVSFPKVDFDSWFERERLKGPPDGR